MKSEVCLVLGVDASINFLGHIASADVVAPVPVLLALMVVHAVSPGVRDGLSEIRLVVYLQVGDELLDLCVKLLRGEGDAS